VRLKYLRTYIVNRYSCVLLSVFVFVFCARCAEAQPQEPKPPLPYVPSPKGAKRFQGERIEGQVVFTQPSAKNMIPAEGVQIALFDEKQTRVLTVRSGENGRFEIKEVAPGAYTLVVGAESLHLLSIPLRVTSPASASAPVVSALLLRMYSNTDRRKSVVTPIKNNALRTELLERVRKDQAIRNEMIQRGVDQLDKEIEARMAAIDAENLTRMKEIVRQYRWPGVALVGADGTEAAFLLVQHATFEFQKEMLPHIRGAYRSGEMAGQNYALLLDRVLVREGKRQVYGTQARPFTDWKNGEPALYPIEDETHVDQRRAEVGLFPLAESLKMLKQMYFPQGKEKIK
jgi:hypothetical protein